MIPSLIHTMMTTLIRVWMATSRHSWRRLPRPQDAPHVHAPGVTPDRMLMIGSGVAAGYGVLHWELSLTGQLAKRVAELTGRGLDIDISVDPSLNVVAAVDIVKTARIGRYDAIVFLIGSLEALELYPDRLWEQHLRALLDTIRAEGPGSVRVLFVAIPQLTDLITLPLPLRPVVRARIRRLNEISAEMIRGRTGMALVPLAPIPADLVDIAGRRVHTEWAELISPAVAVALDAEAPRRVESVDEDARLRALYDLEVLDTDPDDDLQQLVESTRNVFDAAGAAFNLIDGDRAWSKGAVGLSTGAMEVPRRLSFCNTTIEQSRLLVIPDMTVDPVYHAHPNVVGPPSIRFYAGYPVESPDGHRVGSLCVIDTKPRMFSPVEATLLRELALRAQSILWERDAVRS